MYEGMTESRDLNKFLVRMPDGMRDRIAAEAKANNRSMNSEIIARLEASFSPMGTMPEDYEAALAAHGGNTQSLLAAEAIRIRTLLEKIGVDLK